MIAQSMHDFLHSDFGRKTIADWPSLGVSMERPRGRPAPRTLEGKTLVVTGTLDKYTRDQIQS